MGKIVITKQQTLRSEKASDGQPVYRLLLTLFDEKRPYFIQTFPLLEEESILGNIYLARVKDVSRNLNGAFLSISRERTVYLPLTKCREILFSAGHGTARQSNTRAVNSQNTGVQNSSPNIDVQKNSAVLAAGESLRQGDEVVVQIVGEALKTKPPTASEKLSLAGQYCVCSYFGHGLHYSKKLSEKKRGEIDEAVKAQELEDRKRYQFTIRTNAGSIDDLNPLFQEMKAFINIFNTLTDVYRHRTCYSLLYQREAELLGQIKNIPLDAYDEIVTDEDDVYEFLTASFHEKPVRLYRDALLPLSKLYSLETHLKEALGKKVWLSCGGYLVIEPTEAMVVIDVNSGKSISKRKNSSDYYLSINLEAAQEIARQLRLRNYSGMIMVDFINMDDKEANEILLKKLEEYLREDKVPTRLVDMTALGIVEITRKKVSRPLSDFFNR